MKKIYVIVFIFVLSFSLVSCKKHSAFIYDESKSDKVKLTIPKTDGEGEWWKDSSFKVDFICDHHGKIESESDFNAKAYIAWKEERLLVHIDVEDDVRLLTDRSAFLGDNVELYFGSKVGSRGIFHLVLSPNVTNGNVKMAYYTYSDRKTDWSEIHVTSDVNNETSYSYDISLPFSFVDIQPKDGETFALQLYVSDKDEIHVPSYSVQLHNTIDTHLNSYAMSEFVLSDENKKFVKDIWAKSYITNMLLNVIIRGDKKYIEKNVGLNFNDKTFEKHALIEKGGKAYTEFSIPMPKKIDEKFYNLGVSLEGENFTFINAYTKHDLSYGDAKSWVYAMPQETDRNIDTILFYSKTNNALVSYLIYLPESYGKSFKKYPVVYFLHGRGESPVTHTKWLELYEQQVEANKAKEMIFVYVNGLQNSAFANIKSRNLFVEDMIINELIPHVDENFRTIAKREGRIISGWSMGGFASISYGTRYYDTFAACFALASGGRTIRDGMRYGMNEDEATIYSSFEAVNRNSKEIIERNFPLWICIGENDYIFKRNIWLHDFTNELVNLGIKYDLRVVENGAHNANTIMPIVYEEYYEKLSSVFN